MNQKLEEQDIHKTLSMIIPIKHGTTRSLLFQTSWGGLKMKPKETILHEYGNKILLPIGN